MPNAVVDAVVRKQAGQVAVRVEPQDRLDPQFIYRAALGIYWNAEEAVVEDRSRDVESSASSA